MTSGYFPIFNPSLKIACKYVGEPPTRVLASPAIPDYAQHWGLSVAVEGLAAYQHWVSCMVLPIVFQWVDEHKEEVYGRVPRDLRDDIDTVIRAAFEIIREKKAYEEGRKELEEFKAMMASDKLDTSKINPSWTRITANLREEMKEALKHESEPLVAAMR